MRSEKEVYDIVFEILQKQTNAFAWFTLEGSRTNTNIPPDDFQEF